MQAAHQALLFEAVDAVGHRPGGEPAGLRQLTRGEQERRTLPAQRGEHVVLPPVQAELLQPRGRLVTEDLLQGLDAQHDAHGRGVEVGPCPAPVCLQFVDDVLAHAVENSLFAVA